MTRQRASIFLWGVAFVAAVAAALAWFAPASDYLYVPNAAHPVAAKVKVQGEKLPAPGAGAIYYVDVSVRRATWAERLLPFVRPDGATLVPREEVVPPGSSFEARHEDGLREMERSEKVAAAVALEQAGFKVQKKARGALVEAVASDAPAATVLDPGDVIVGARGKPISTPEQLRRSFEDVRPGAGVVLLIRRDGKAKTVTVRVTVSFDSSKTATVAVTIN